MSYFPLCIDLTDALVFLVGSGPQIREKQTKLLPFEAKLCPMDTLAEKDFERKPSLVIIGDLDRSEAERYSSLCHQRGIPVNVVDMPELCTFFFPALIKKGALTVSVSTDGKNPSAAAYLRSYLEQQLPDRTDEILDWLQVQRQVLRSACPQESFRRILKAITSLAFTRNRPLTSEEVNQLLKMDQNASIGL